MEYLCAASCGGRQQYHMPAVLSSQEQARCRTASAVPVVDGVASARWQKRRGQFELCTVRLPCQHDTAAAQPQNALGVVTMSIAHCPAAIIAHCSMFAFSTSTCIRLLGQASRPSAHHASRASEHLTFAACKPALHLLLRLPLTFSLHRSPISVLALAGH